LGKAYIINILTPLCNINIMLSPSFHLKYNAQHNNFIVIAIKRIYRVKLIMSNTDIERIVLFDGVCNLCNGAVQLIIKYEKNKSMYFASLQSEFAKTLLSENNIDSIDMSTVIFYENHKLYYKSSAALRIAGQLKFPFFLLSAFRIIPSFASDMIYSFIAKNRYRWFGKKESCMIPSPELKARFLD
jgi:predicted DCC family thiol-disulfide oxidoreductase YuxK